LEQVAYIALISAANRFRPEEGRDFLAYAVPTIRGQLKRHFRDHGWTVRPPRRVQEIQFRVLVARERLAESLGRAPSTAEIAKDLGESVTHVGEALSLDGCFTPSSLDVPVESGAASLGDLVPDAGTDEKWAAEARIMLGPAVRALSERDRYVLRLRFFDGLTQKEIGDEIGITQAQVSRMLTRITGQLRAHLVPPSPSASPELHHQLAS
jgi:RNA polymerase sigma-B factor